MIDDAWIENVGPLIVALESLGIDPVAWANDPDFDVFYEKPNPQGIQLRITRDLGCSTIDDVYFACGYLQATGNLTGRTWAEQLRGWNECNTK